MRCRCRRCRAAPSHVPRKGPPAARSPPGTCDPSRRARSSCHETDSRVPLTSCYPPFRMPLFCGLDGVAVSRHSALTATLTATRVGRATVLLVRLLSRSQQVTELLDRIFLQRRQQMRVRIHGDADLRVSQQFLDDLGMNAEAEEQARTAMAQAMEPPPRQPGLLEQWEIGPHIERPHTYRATVACAEHSVVIYPPVAGFQPPRQLPCV